MNKDKAADVTYIDEVILCYHESKYDEMSALIIDYPAPLFFIHFYEYSNSVKWRSDASKYLLFVGVTYQYIKEIERIKT